MKMTVMINLFQVLTKDSVTVSVDAVVYYRVSNATISVANVENAHHSTRYQSLAFDNIINFTLDHPQTTVPDNTKEHTGHQEPPRNLVRQRRNLRGNAGMIMLFHLSAMKYLLAGGSGRGHGTLGDKG